MHAGGGMVTVDIERSSCLSSGVFLAPKAPSMLAAAACWRSSALRLNKARCIMVGFRNNLHGVLLSH